MYQYQIQSRRIGKFYRQSSLQRKPEAIKIKHFICIPLNFFCLFFSRNLVLFLSFGVLCGLIVFSVYPSWKNVEKIFREKSCDIETNLYYLRKNKSILVNNYTHLVASKYIIINFVYGLCDLYFFFFNEWSMYVEIRKNCLYKNKLNIFLQKKKEIRFHVNFV